MSTETKAILDLLQQYPEQMPLLAVDNGRFKGVQPATASLFAGCGLPSEAQAGWLLYTGFGARSHAVSQDLHTREGSYWHALYHRMEPDDWNAKYWFRQVGTHPIAEALAAQARDAGWNPGRNWDPARFVDFVSAARSGGNQRDLQLAIAVQDLEWRLLFEFCVKEIS
jgi:hypothetical protein